MRIARRWFTLAVILLAAGCGEDPAGPEPTVSVLVTNLLTGDPLAGIKVVAMDQATNTPLAGPFLTGESGVIDFGLAPESDLRYLVFGGLAWNVHRQQDWYRDGADLSGATQSDPVTHIQLRPAVPQDGLPRIAGQIVDATTGAPLDRAFIGVTPQLTAYSGETDSGTDVTGPDGAFVVHEIAFSANPVTGNLAQVEQLFVSRQGYRPRRWVHRPDNGDNNLDISGVVIGLNPLDEADQGTLTGRILHDGLPVPNLAVGLGGFSDAAKTGFGLPGQVARTDERGRFRFNQLTAGQYVIHPGFALWDGYMPPLGQALASAAVSNGQTADIGDVVIWREIVPEKGDNALVLRKDGFLALAWSAVAGAQAYNILINGVAVQQTSGTDLLWTLPNNLANGWHRWSVLAVKNDSNILGSMQITSWWQLRD